MTARVDPNLQTERLRTGRRLLLRDLIVTVDGLEITIPAGFDTDFSSIPYTAVGVAALGFLALERWFAWSGWAFVALMVVAGAVIAAGLVRWSRIDVAGVVHDYLYATAAVPRRRADHIWRLVALSGAHRAYALQAWVGYFALRVGGWHAWRSHRRRADR